MIHSESESKSELKLKENATHVRDYYIPDNAVLESHFGTYILWLNHKNRCPTAVSSRASSVMQKI